MIATSRNLDWRQVWKGIQLSRDGPPAHRLAQRRAAAHATAAPPSEPDGAAASTISSSGQALGLAITESGSPTPSAEVALTVKV